MNPSRCLAGALFAFLLAGSQPVSAKEQSGRPVERWAGSWPSAILVIAAEFEPDLALDLSEGTAGGTLVGHLSLPDQAVLSQKVESLAVKDREISFTYTRRQRPFAF